MRRYAASGLRQDLLTCARLLQTASGDAQRARLVSGFEEAFKGRTPPPMPEELAKALAQSGLASPYFRARVGDPKAVQEALKLAADDSANREERLLCIRLFGEVKVDDAVPILLGVAAGGKDAEIRKAALGALLKYDSPRIGAEVASQYALLPAEVQPAAQTLLTSRAAWILEFLRHIESGAITKESLPSTTIAVLRQHEDPTVVAAARKILGEGISGPKPPLRAEQEKIRQVLAAAPGDPYKGEVTFLQRCSACHALFHKGGHIGPDLTPYQRNDLGTMLTSILSPSAEIREGYVNQLITTTDNRTLSGFIRDQDGSVVVLRGLDGQDVSIARAEIREMRAAPASLMPEGLLIGLSEQDLRDFFAYLRIPQPITR